MALLQLFSPVDVLECLVDVAHFEGAPSLVLEELMVVLVVDHGDVVLLHGLVVVLQLFAKDADLDVSVGHATLREALREKRVLEVKDGLGDLISFGENHSQLEEHFALLVEVGRHA